MLTEEGTVDAETPLLDMGLDSLSAMDLQNLIASSFPFSPPSTTILFDYPTATWPSKTCFRFNCRRVDGFFIFLPCGHNISSMFHFHATLIEARVGSFRMTAMTKCPALSCPSNEDMWEAYQPWWLAADVMTSQSRR